MMMRDIAAGRKMGLTVKCPCPCPDLDEYRAGRNHWGEAAAAAAEALSRQRVDSEVVGKKIPGGAAT